MYTHQLPSASPVVQAPEGLLPEKPLAKSSFHTVSPAALAMLAGTSTTVRAGCALAGPGIAGRLLAYCACAAVLTAASSNAVYLSFMVVWLLC